MTKRTKNLKKQDIPSLDDPISKLNHIGKETVKKLNELKASAEEASLDLPITTDLFRWHPALRSMVSLSACMHWQGSKLIHMTCQSNG